MSSRASLLTALCLCGPLVASDAKEPYHVRIVVHAEKNQLLTKVFRDQIQRELKDGVQAGLGALARVEVTDTHPLLADIRARGLGGVDQKKVTNERTYFVLIDFSGTHYRVQTRLYDGLTGLWSPVVRQGRTQDRAYVARTAAFLMQRDISLLGTVASEPDKAQQVRLDLKGGELGVDLAKWVKKGEVFQLLRADGPGPNQPVESAFLQVVEPARDGSCACKLHTRYKLSRVAGLRAVLLGTRSGPVRLRLMEEKKDGTGSVRLQGSLSVHLRKHGFEGEEASKIQQTASSRREVNTATAGDKGVFDHLAFVSVYDGQTLRAKIPVPILDDRPTVLVVPGTSEEGDLILTNYRAFSRSVLTAIGVQNEQFRRIQELGKDPEKRKEALKTVKDSLTRLQEDHATLTKEREEVTEALKNLDPKDRPRPEDMQKIDKRLAELKEGEGDLRKHIGLLEQIEKDENDPGKKDWRIKIEGAKLLEKEAEVGKALAVYEKVPEEMMNEALKKHFEELKKQWAPKNEKHAEARQFIYETWPGLDTTPALKERMKEARESFATCEAALDTIGPTKMRNVLKQHLERIEKELGDLKPNVNNEDEKAAQVVNEVVPELQKLDRAIQKFLDKNKPGR